MLPALAALWVAFNPLKWHIHADGMAAIDHVSFQVPNYRMMPRTSIGVEIAPGTVAVGSLR
jgi:hypothetical protein